MEGMSGGFGSTQSGNCTTCGKHIQQNLGRHRFILNGAGAAVAMLGDLVYGLEGHSSGLRRSYEKGA